MEVTRHSSSRDVPLTILGVLALAMLVLGATGTSADTCPFGCAGITCYEVVGGGSFWHYKGPCIWNWYCKSPMSPFDHSGNCPVQRIACYGSRICDPGANQPGEAQCGDNLPMAQYVTDNGCWAQCNQTS
jgi:hypothetical protein